MGDGQEVAEHPVVGELLALDEELLRLQEKLQASLLQIDEQYAPQYEELQRQRFERLIRVDQEAAGTSAPSRPAAKRQSARAHGTPAIPGFWRTVLQNHPDFLEDIEEYDEPVLDYLQNITGQRKSCGDEVGRGSHFTFELRFFFDSNPYFSNSELRKVFWVKRQHQFMDCASDDSYQCYKVEATPIDWHPGKDVTVEAGRRRREKKKKDKSKADENYRHSFFRVFFRNLGPDCEIPPEYGHPEDEECDGEDFMSCLLNEDYERGRSLYDNLVPRAVKWYTGQACESFDIGDGEEDGQGDEEDIFQDAQEEVSGTEDCRSQ
eukprot:TRINITY_DN113335_c0_g1_i1.p1 TRINITY_DN113335_c0_g1~~TRINITY_DN113335_c0_g1_i1.p1  ORF type:complete len:321 (-),score=86.42 TRINITY_DN113335_c0_g1_i1:3-965(-)